MTGSSSWDTGAVQQIIESLQHKPGALLPILHAIQDSVGYIPPESVPMIADALQQTRAEVHGVITFYHHFRMTPPGRHVVQICRAEACQAAGGEALAAHAEARLGCGFGETTADGSATLDAVYCFGNCALAPAASVGGRLIGRATPERLDDAIRAEAER